MFNIIFFREILKTSMTVSIITCSFIQKTKKYISKSENILIYSFFINIFFGIIFSLTFTNFLLYEAIWVGLLSFIGADTIFKSLEGKLSTYENLRKK